jgi:nucleoside-diphosphate-sugar epimerase
MAARHGTVPGRLVVAGLGYAGAAVAREAASAGWRVAGTVRDPARAAPAPPGVEVVPFAEAGPAIAAATHLLATAAPGEDAGDPVLAAHGEAVPAAPDLRWIGYVSTTGVYGDRGGAWVDERTAPRPASERSRARLAAEQAWLGLHRQHGLAVHVFRLAGIYGPGRNSLDAVRAGTARRIVKPGQVFGRIHVADAAGVLEASIARPDPGALYTVTDDEPAPPQAVVAYAARLLGLPPPPEEPFAEARLSPMAASFYGESKRVRNQRIKQHLGYRLRYPTYREGLQALLAEQPPASRPPQPSSRRRPGSIEAVRPGAPVPNAAAQSDPGLRRGDGDTAQGDDPGPGGPGQDGEGQPGG